MRTTMHQARALAHLAEANLFRADLRGANLSGTTLWGANLSEAKGSHVPSMSAVIFNSVKADQNTVWPEWFDPEQAPGLNL